MPRLGLGLGLSRGNYINPLAALIKCGLIQYTDPFEDEAGKTSRQTVRGLALVGDGNTYATFSGFTDADLPTNCNIEFEVEINQVTGTNGIFGFDVSGNDEFWIGTQDTQVRALITLLQIRDSHKYRYFKYPI